MPGLLHTGHFLKSDPHYSALHFFGHPSLFLLCDGSDAMDENEIATGIKKQLSAEWADRTWQVLVGRNFGSFVPFVESRYIYFYLAQVRPEPHFAWQDPLGRGF